MPGCVAPRRSGHWPRRLTSGAIAAGLLLAPSARARPEAAGGFQPFGDIAELAPHSFTGLCGERDRQTGLAKCERFMRTKLADDGDVEFGWRMEVDPERVLSLDLEGANGVQIRSCAPNALELELPEAYAHHASKGTLIVASRFAHSCAHLAEKHVYLRVKAIEKTAWRGDEKVASGSMPSQTRQRVMRAKLRTEELPDISHAVPSVSFNFSYMPVEARDTSSYPIMRTDFGQWQTSSPAQSRKLQDSTTAVNGMLKFLPKQISNFGWNWNFFMNTTENPEFNYTLPGMRGYMKLKQPYVKIHSGLFLNFSSHFKSVMKIPHVVWRMGANAHGAINGRMLTDVKTTSEITEDPFHLFELPVLEQLKDIQWFSTIDMNAGTMPLSVEPGFQFQAKMYHTGIADATIQLGCKTNFKMHPEAVYDSNIGLLSKIKADFKDVDIYPPLWIISTKHFEMGIALEPTVWLRGQFGQVPNSMAGFEIRPYLNMTVKRAGGEDSVAAEGTRTLIVYPFRVMGLPQVRFSKKYKVKVSANGGEFSTSAELNWGQVEFHDHVAKFNAGSMAQQAVLDAEFTVKLFEVTLTTFGPEEREMGSTQVTCGSILSGECQPNPTVAQLQADGHSVTIELALIWQDNPIPWFASRIRGVSLSFPKIMIDGVHLKQYVPQLAATGASPQALFLRVSHAGHTYVTDVVGFSVADNKSTASGAKTLALGPTFLESWMPCSLPGCGTGKIELFYGQTMLSSESLPQIPWNVPKPTPEPDDTAKSAPDFASVFDGTHSSDAEEKAFDDALEAAVMAAMTNTNSVSPAAPHLTTSSTAARVIPVSVAMKPLHGASSPIAMVNMEAHVTDLNHASLFLHPSSPEVVYLDQHYEMEWQVSFAHPGAQYQFRVSAFKVVPADDVAGYQYPSVGDKVLQPVHADVKHIVLLCRKSQVDGVGFDNKPCSFKNKFHITSKFYAVRDRIVVMIEWMDHSSHVLLSPPMDVEPGSPGGLFPGGRRLWDQADWDQRLADNKDACKEKEMHFELGFGCLSRARMKGAAAALLPIIQAEAPSINTNYHSLGTEDLMNSDLKKLIPDFLCSDGMCKGVLPSCTESNFEVMHFPELVFNFDRPFKFADLNNGGTMIKEVMAYAFSVMPEAVTILVERMNSTTTVRAPFFHFASQGPAARYMPTQVPPSVPLDWTGMPIEPTSPPWGAPGSPMASLPRRLRSSQEQIDDATSTWSSGLEGKQVTMRFTHGTHYRVDRPLLEMMMRHKMFQPLEDDLSRDLGPAYIASFEVRGGEPLKIKASKEQPEYAALTSSFRLIPAIGACISLLSVVAFVAFQRRRRKVYETLAPDATGAIDSHDVDLPIRQSEPLQ